MKIGTLWVVMDPTPESMLEDLIFEAQAGTAKLEHVIRGSGMNATVREHWAFFTKEVEAREEAGRRLRLRDLRAS